MNHRTNRTTSVVHVGPNEGETIDVLGDVSTFKLTIAITGGDIILATVVTQPGGGPPGLHTHPPQEAFYVLEGEYEVGGMGEDGEPFTVRALPGSAFYVPPGAAHNFKNVGATPGRLLAIYLSEAMERFPRDLAAAAAGATPGSPPDRAKLKAVFAAHEVAFVGPGTE